MKSYAIILVSIFLLVGCQSRRYTFRSVDTISNDANSVTQEINPIKFKIAFGGIKKAAEDTSPTAKFVLKFTNTGARPVTFNPHSYDLIDDDANNFTPVVQGATGPILLYPQTSANFTLLYPLPPGYNLKRVGSFRLAWNYDIEGTKYRRLTKFIKKEVEYRNRYYGSSYNYYPGHSGFYTSLHFGHKRRHRFRSGISFGFGGGCY